MDQVQLIEKMKQKRTAADLTQRQLAAFLGVGEIVPCLWETQKCLPLPRHTRKILVFLKMPTEALRVYKRMTKKG